ncbi:uncharacterized protein LOC62_05G006824 [Vanrija pseudolonga]|uniref:F-box domain-containing protein n=1 Tax=Vanrija pseudolonga TaxID=143232 RepID=A0AAF1BMD2_9TREE|nr:hypothetical protein LOC62_05G006824 [Vanrija pseudolonga]
MFTPTSFPHITESIVHYVITARDHDTLLALRATCKGMKELVDPVLFKHAALTSTSNIASLRPYLGPPAILVKWIEDQDTSRILPDGNHPAFLSALGHGQILDIKGSALPGWIHASGVGGGQLDTVRDLTVPPSPALTLRARKNVRFIQHARVSNLASATACLDLAARPGATSLVINIGLHPQVEPMTSPAPPPITPLPESGVDELVMVFNKVANTETLRTRIFLLRASLSVDEDRPALEHIPRLLGLNMTSTRRITVVGLETLDSRWMIPGPKLAPAALRSRVAAEIHGVAIKAYFERHGRPKPITELQRSSELLRSLTLEEYREEVGDEEFRINCVE